MSNNIGIGIVPEGLILVLPMQQDEAKDIFMRLAEITARGKVTVHFHREEGECVAFGEFNTEPSPEDIAASVNQTLDNLRKGTAPKF